MPYDDRDMAAVVDTEQPDGSVPAPAEEGGPGRMAAAVGGGRAHDFRSELSRWLEPLRQALTHLLREVGSPGTPRVLQQQLKVPYATCWRVFRIVRATDVTTEAQHAPLPGGLKSLLASARGHGATEQTAVAVTTAAQQFRTFIRRHAEDRTAFESMVATDTGGGRSETVILQRRRAAYRATSQLWGVQTDLQLNTLVVGPPDRDGPPDRYPTLRLRLQRGVRRLQSDAQVTLLGYHTRPAGDADEPSPTPLDPRAAARYGMPILPAFSSDPLPAIEPVTMASGWCLYNMVGGDVGLRSNIEFASGEHAFEVPAEIDADGRPLYMLNFTTTRKPIALLVMDLLLHRLSWRGATPQSLVYHHQEGDFTQATAERSQRFPGDERVAFAGAADLLHLIEAPRYGEMLRYAAAQRQWNLADFDAYRLLIPYPLMCTTARVFFYGRNGGTPRQ